jgi:hypothetical protein
MSWGSFLIGMLFGGVLCGFIGAFTGCLFTLLYKIKSEEAANPWHGIVKPLEQGQMLCGEFFLSTKVPPCGDGDDDGGSPPQAVPPEPEMEYWRNNWWSNWRTSNVRLCDQFLATRSWSGFVTFCPPSRRAKSDVLSRNGLGTGWLFWSLMNGWWEWSCCVADTDYRGVLNDDESLATFLRNMKRFDSEFVSSMASGQEFSIKLEIHGNSGRMIHCKVNTTVCDRPASTQRAIQKN